MKHLYKASIWQGSSGQWYVNDTSNLGGIAGLWWVPSRLLAASPASYIQMLHDDFNASHFYYDINTDVLLFSWDNYNDAHHYQLFVNRKAREKNFMV